MSTVWFFFFFPFIYLLVIYQVLLYISSKINITLTQYFFPEQLQRVVRSPPTARSSLPSTTETQRSSSTKPQAIISHKKIWIQQHQVNKKCHISKLGVFASIFIHSLVGTKKVKNGVEALKNIFNVKDSGLIVLIKNFAIANSIQIIFQFDVKKMWFLCKGLP